MFDSVWCKPLAQETSAVGGLRHSDFGVSAMVTIFSLPFAFWSGYQSFPLWLCSHWVSLCLGIAFRTEPYRTIYIWFLGCGFASTPLRCLCACSTVTTSDHHPQASSPSASHSGCRQRVWALVLWWHLLLCGRLWWSLSLGVSVLATIGWRRVCSCLGWRLREVLSYDLP